MKCIICGSETKNSNYCMNCGADLRTYKMVLALSHAYYNKGLMLAKKERYTDAIKYLERSISLDKKNIDALNLLGLCYLKIYDVARAISLFIVSTNYMPNGNKASRYLQEIEKDSKYQLDIIDDNIEKYNASIDYASNGAFDLAIIELRKVINQSMGFVDAYNLLALCYISKGEKDKAIKLLERTLRCDHSNESAIIYLSELTETNTDEIFYKYNKNTDDVKPIKEGLIFKTKGIRKEKGIFYIVAGAVLSFLITWFILTPLAVKDETDRLSNTIIENSSELSLLEEENKQLRSQIKEYEEKENNANEEETAKAENTEFEEQTTE